MKSLTEYIKQCHNELHDNEGKRGNGWRTLLRSKLSKDDYEYITRITQRKVRKAMK